jgi:organic radical activating enzyme
MIDRKASYTAADTVPVKLFLHEEVKRLRPVHVNWMPTNRCNLNCPFCSCAGRDQSEEMPIDVAVKVICNFARLGCKAVTVTGGGEPLCYGPLMEMLQEFHHYGIDIGLVTNGLLFNRLSLATVSLLTWCRISNADGRSLTPAYRRILDRVTEVPIDWAFSHVVSKEPNLEEIRQVVEYARAKHFTHVRLVGDLMEPEAVPFAPVMDALTGIDDLVIYQPRKEYSQSTSCLIGYVKPVVAPNFRMYLCCGVQYALDPTRRDMPEELSMGSALNLDSVYEKPEPYRVHCNRCYYGAYNSLLATLTSELKHVNFL